MSRRRILFLAEGQLGDLLLLTPALRATKTTFPESHLTVLTVQRRRYSARDEPGDDVIVRSPRGGTSVVVSESLHVDEVVEVDRALLRSLSGVARVRAEWKIVRYLRKAQFDTVVCTFPQDRFLLWSLLGTWAVAPIQSECMDRIIGGLRQPPRR